MFGAAQSPGQILAEILFDERQISGYRREPGASALRLIKPAATR